MCKLIVIAFLLVAVICTLLGTSEAQSNCPMACPHIMDPVCGTADGRDYRYFANGCRMRAYNECERSGSERELHEVDLSNCDEPGWE